MTNEINPVNMEKVVALKASDVLDERITSGFVVHISRLKVGTILTEIYCQGIVGMPLMLRMRAHACEQKSEDYYEPIEH
jgi:hypothetical protein